MQKKVDRIYLFENCRAFLFESCRTLLLLASFVAGLAILFGHSLANPLVNSRADLGKKITFLHCFTCYPSTLPDTNWGMGGLLWMTKLAHGFETHKGAKGPLLKKFIWSFVNRILHYS